MDKAILSLKEDMHTTKDISQDKMKAHTVGTVTQVTMVQAIYHLLVKEAGLEVECKLLRKPMVKI